MCEYDFLDLSSDQLFIAFSVIVGITLVMNITLVAYCYYKLVKPVAPKPSDDECESADKIVKNRKKITVMVRPDESGSKKKAGKKKPKNSVEPVGGISIERANENDSIEHENEDMEPADGNDGVEMAENKAQNDNEEVADAGAEMNNVMMNDDGEYQQLEQMG